MLFLLCLIFQIPTFATELSDELEERISVFPQRIQDTIRMYHFKTYEGTTAYNLQFIKNFLDKFEPESANIVIELYLESLNYHILHENARGNNFFVESSTMQEYRKVLIDAYNHETNKFDYSKIENPTHIEMLKETYSKGFKYLFYGDKLYLYVNYDELNDVKQYLTPEYSDFITLQQKITNKPSTKSDMLKQYEYCSDLFLEFEQYAKKYPNSYFKDELERLYKYTIQDYLINYPELNGFDLSSNTIKPELLNEYLTYVESNPNSIASNYIADHIYYMQTINFSAPIFKDYLAASNSTIDSNYKKYLPQLTKASNDKPSNPNVVTIVNSANQGQDFNPYDNTEKFFNFMRLLYRSRSTKESYDYIAKYLSVLPQNYIDVASAVHINRLSNDRMYYYNLIIDNNLHYEMINAINDNNTFNLSKIKKPLARDIAKTLNNDKYKIFKYGNFLRIEPNYNEYADLYLKSAQNIQTIFSELDLLSNKIEFTNDFNSNCDIVESRIIRANNNLEKYPPMTAFKSVAHDEAKIYLCYLLTDYGLDENNKIRLELIERFGDFASNHPNYGVSSSILYMLYTYDYYNFQLTPEFMNELIAY
jgi:hypothetical protein